MVLGRLTRPRMPVSCPQELVFAREKQIPPSFEVNPVPGEGEKARHAAATPCSQARDLVWGPAPLLHLFLPT